MTTDIKYCLPILESRAPELRGIIDRNLGSYSFFEVWLDYLETIEPALLNELTAAYPGALIFLFRRQNLEPVKMPRSRREDIMKILEGRDALLDLDISSQSGDIEFMRKNAPGLKTILSYHNYNATPGGQDLHDIVSKMEDASAHIYKIACMCKNEADVLNLLGLCLKLKEQGKKYIVLGMGGHGKITRIICSLWGNQMLFAPLDSASASAPGQLTRQQLDNIFANLK